MDTEFSSPGKAHPSFYHVLQLLQEETARIHQDIEKLEGQSSPRKKKKYTSLENRNALIVDRSQLQWKVWSKLHKKKKYTSLENRNALIVDRSQLQWKVWSKLHKKKKYTSLENRNALIVDRSQLQWKVWSKLHKKKKYTSLENRNALIVDRYEAYRTEDNIPGYLRAIGHNFSGKFGRNSIKRRNIRPQRTEMP
ncbi:hypothetical protein ANN_01745 [Periplaneta americana]|uniref:Uncharacterized protein n=1 Tax=Periplaneta americana TaxID=6978 RepID=A0ABQ8TUD1_PERAM|nr:hypothetical protein ANN_01745 [Periplaneta americana]